jgi:malic enzyme
MMISMELINSLKIVDKKIDNIKVVISGAGFAGYEISGF